MFPFLYDSYAEQHRDEVMKILEVIQTMDVPVLMGDFNHGPASPGQGFGCVGETLICLGCSIIVTVQLSFVTLHLSCNHRLFQSRNW